MLNGSELQQGALRLSLSILIEKGLCQWTEGQEGNLPTPEPIILMDRSGHPWSCRFSSAPPSKIGDDPWGESREPLPSMTTSLRQQQERAMYLIGLHCYFAHYSAVAGDILRIGNGCRVNADPAGQTAPSTFSVRLLKHIDVQRMAELCPDFGCA